MLSRGMLPERGNRPQHRRLSVYPSIRTARQEDATPLAWPDVAELVGREGSYTRVDHFNVKTLLGGSGRQWDRRTTPTPGRQTDKSLLHSFSPALARGRASST